MLEQSRKHKLVVNFEYVGRISRRELESQQAELGNWQLCPRRARGSDMHSPPQYSICDNYDAKQIIHEALYIEYLLIVWVRFEPTECIKKHWL